MREAEAATAGLQELAAVTVSTMLEDVGVAAETADAVSAAETGAGLVAETVAGTMSVTLAGTAAKAVVGRAAGTLAGTVLAMADESPVEKEGEMA